MLPTWLLSWAQRLRPTASRHKDRPRRTRPLLERLESRTVPATALTVIPGAAGSGSLDILLGPDDGTILLADGADGTVSTGALAAVGPDTDILIQASESIRFLDLGGGLDLQTTAGHTVTFSTDTAGGGAISFASPADVLTTQGAAVVFAAATDLALAAVTTGGGDIALTAANLDAQGALSAGNVTAAADSIRLQQAVNAGTGTVTLRPRDDAVAIDLGGADVPGTTLGLDNAEVGLVTAALLHVGSSTHAGGLTVSDTITAPPTVGTLFLHSSTITEGPSGSLTVPNLAVEAADGITLTGTNAIGRFEAATATGGIDFANSGDLDLGGVTPVLAGVRVDGASGDIQITNAGSITANVSEDAIQGPANVTLLAQGAAADLVTGGGGNIERVRGSGDGTVRVEAGRDIVLGNPTGFGNVTATNGPLLLAAGRDLVVQFQTFVNGFGLTGLTATAGRDIAVLSTGGITGAIVNSGLGPIALTTGAGGTFTLDPGPGGDLHTAGGDVTVRADDMVINTPLNAVTGAVTLRAASPTWPIDLGTDSPGSLGLTDDELDRITGSILRIGNSVDANPIRVTAPITGSASYGNTLVLSSSAAVSAAGGSLAVADLAIQAAGGVTLTTANAVSRLAGSTGGTAFRFTAAGSLMIGTVNGVSGITTAGGAVELTAQGPGSLLTVGADLDAGADVTLTADDLTVTAAIDAGTQTVTLQPFTAGRGIDLGTDTPDRLGLTDVELDRVSAAVLRVGNTNTAGDITVTAPVSQADSGYGTLSLRTTGQVLGPNAGTDVVGTSLALQAAGGVTLQTQVANLAASAGNLVLDNAGALTIPAAGVDGVVGLTANTPAGGLAVIAGGTITIDNGPAAFDVRAAGTGSIMLCAADGVMIAAGVVVQSGDAVGGGTVRLEANCNDAAGTDNVSLGAGAQVLTRGSLVLTADPDGGGTGGTILFAAGTVLDGPDGNAAAEISLTSASDFTLTNLRGGTVAVTSSGGNLRDDGDDTTFVQAANLSLTAAGAVGGDTALGVADLVAQGAAFRAAVDIDLQGGTLTVVQTGAGGNVQLREVDGAFSTTGFSFTPGGVGGQLALLASGAPLLVDAALTLTAAAARDLLLAATDGNAVVVMAPVTNEGAGRTVTLAATSPVIVNAAVTSAGSQLLTSAGNDAGAGVFVNAAVTVTGPGGTATLSAERDVNTGTAGSVTAAGGVTVRADADDNGVGSVAMNAGSSLSGGSIDVTAAENVNVAVLDAGAGSVSIVAQAGSLLDANGPGSLNVTGGTVTLTATGIAGINLDVNATTSVSATGSPVALRSTGAADLPVAAVSAGAGNVTLSAAAGITDANGPAVNVTGGVINLSGGANSGIDIDVSAATSVSASGGLVRVENVGGAALPVGTVSATEATFDANDAPLTVAGSVNVISSSPTALQFLDGTTFTQTNGSITAAGGVLLGGSGAENLSGAVTQTGGSITAAVLRVNSGAGVTLDRPANDLALVAVAANGPIVLRDADDLTVGVNGTGITSGGAPVTLTTGGNLVLEQPVDAGNAAVVLNSGGILSGPLLTAADGLPEVVGSTVTMTAAGSIGSGPGPLETDAATLSADAPAGSLFVRDTAGGLAVTLARTAGMPLRLDSAADLTLVRISAAGSSVTLSAAGNVNGTTGGDADVTAASLTIMGAAGVGTTAPLETAVGELSATAGAGGVRLMNAGSVNVLSVVTAGGGAIDLAALGQLVVMTAVTAPGDVTLTATEAATPAAGADNVIVMGGALVRSDGGNVALRAGDRVEVQAGATVRASSNSVTLTGGFNDNDGGGAVAVHGSLDAFATPVLRGGPRNDQLTVTAAPSNGLALDGQAGTDSYAVTFGNLLGPVAIADTGVETNDTAEVMGTAGSDLFVVAATQTTLAGQMGGTVSYATGVEQLAVRGLGGDDTFRATSSVGLTVTIDGGDQRLLDVLVFDGQAQSVQVSDASLAVAGQRAVNHVNVETVRVADAAGPLRFAGAADGPRRFVQDLYFQALGRLGGDAELNFWVSLLPSLGQQGVAATIFRSGEALARLVDRMYVQFLDRFADPGGRAFWVQQLATGALTTETLIISLVSSAEFGQRAGALFGGGDTNANFVRGLYEFVLQRPASAGDVIFWSGLVPQLGRAGVAAQFVGSPEFLGLVVRTLYGDSASQTLPYLPFLLHRTGTPAPSEIAYWVGTRLDIVSLQLLFASSPEFFGA